MRRELESTGWPPKLEKPATALSMTAMAKWVGSVVTVELVMPELVSGKDWTSAFARVRRNNLLRPVASRMKGLGPMSRMALELKSTKPCLLAELPARVRRAPVERVRLPEPEMALAVTLGAEMVRLALLVMREAAGRAVLEATMSVPASMVVFPE